MITPLVQIRKLSIWQLFGFTLEPLLTSNLP
jgi:hypothetical protein